MYFDFPPDIQNILNQFSLLVHVVLFSVLIIEGMLAYKRPILAVSGIIILLPSYLFRTSVFGIPTTFLEMAFITVFLIYVFNHRIQDIFINLRAQKIFKPIILLIIASIISVLIAPNTAKALGIWKAYIIEPILFFLLLLHVVKTDKDKEIILWALGISALPIALLAIVQKFTGFGIALPHWQAENTRRVTAFFTSPNAAGLYLGPIIAMYTSWLILGMKKSNKKNILKIGFIVLAVLATIFTVSRGTWFGLLAAIFFLAFFYNKKWTLIAASISIGILFLIPQGRNAIIPLITFQQHSGQNRISLWSGSLEYLTASPKNFILGAGLFGFPEIHENFRDPLKTEPLIYPHNIILNFWMELGLLGLIAFAWIFFIIFKSLAKNESQKTNIHTITIIVAMMVIVFHGLLDVPYFKNDLSMLFWTLMALFP